MSQSLWARLMILEDLMMIDDTDDNKSDTSDHDRSSSKKHKGLTASSKKSTLKPVFKYSLGLVLKHQRNIASSYWSSEVGDKSSDECRTWLFNQKLNCCLTFYRWFNLDSGWGHKNRRREYFCWDEEQQIRDRYWRRSAQRILFSRTIKYPFSFEFSCNDRVS